MVSEMEAASWMAGWAGEPLELTQGKAIASASYQFE